jgi:hypothetical protein
MCDELFDVSAIFITVSAPALVPFTTSPLRRGQVQAQDARNSMSRMPALDFVSTATATALTAPCITTSSPLPNLTMPLPSHLLAR